MDDSPAFRKALEIWLPLAVARRDSPRQAKRFINHARFLSMRSSGAESENSWREKLIFLEAFVPGAWQSWKRVRGMNLLERIRRLNRLKRRAISLWSAHKEGLPPEMLVALMAISYVRPEAIGDNSLEKSDFEMGWMEFMGEISPSIAETASRSAWKHHTSTFPSQWPPTSQQMEIFRKWMDTIRQG